MTKLWEPINGVYTATSPLFSWAQPFLNVDGAAWVSAVISAGFGAGVGAWMAGRIADRTKLKHDLLSEMRSVDIAITICASTIDLAGSLKKQYSSEILKEFNEAVAAFEAYKKNENRNSIFELRIKNRKLQTIEPPISELQNLVLKDMSTSPNGVKSIIALRDSVGNLNGMISAYNTLLEAFKSGNLPHGFKPEHYYLSIPIGGVVNDEYGSAVKGIATYTDDVLFFAYKLSGCLTLRGIEVSKEYKKTFGEKRFTRELSLFDENVGLIPSDHAYEGWMRGWESNLPKSDKRKRFWKFRKKR
ncbi:hypothetical protein [Pseudomonas oryzihabitans]|uniref:hypothetical protein n=1 Tax=Pseudomonas oryzihabitans TaxID=47885 RepID=UPI00119E4B75|nr:hypothetical protein [Pseudomonas psychrotolerans]